MTKQTSHIQNTTLPHLACMKRSESTVWDTVMTTSSFTLLLSLHEVAWINSLGHSHGYILLAWINSLGQSYHYILLYALTYRGVPSKGLDQQSGTQSSLHPPVHSHLACTKRSESTLWDTVIATSSCTLPPSMHKEVWINSLGHSHRCILLYTLI